MFELLMLFMGLVGPQSETVNDEHNDTHEDDHATDEYAHGEIIPLHQLADAGVFEAPGHEHTSHHHNDHLDDENHDHAGHDHEHGAELIDLPVADIPELGISIIQNDAAIHTLHQEDVILPDHVKLPEITLPDQANAPVFGNHSNDDTTEVDETSDAKPDHAGRGKDGTDDNPRKGGGKPDRGGDTTDGGDTTTGPGDDTDGTDPVTPDEPEILSRYVSGVENGYNVAINFTGAWTAELQAAFIESAEHISQTILKDIPDVSGEYAADDIEIDAALVDIDGPGGVLGRAGPTVIRTDTGLPVEGIMEFDTADAQAYADVGLWTDIVFHEMMHTLGVGPLWDYVGLTEGSVEDGNLRFTGDMATEAYQTEFSAIAGSDALAASGVPIETHGGSGTAGAHWDEDLFGDEIMTGYINGSNYLSGMTVASLEDLGYDTYLDDPNSRTDETGTAPDNILSKVAIA